MIGQVKKKTRW